MKHKVKIIKDHPIGIKKGRVVEVDDKLKKRLEDGGYIAKSSKKDE